MQVEIKCKTCGVYLDYEFVISPIGTLIIKVKPCTDMKCYNCNGCEDSKELASTKQTLKTIETIIKDLKENGPLRQLIKEVIGT